MKRNDLVKWLDTYLALSEYQDISLNGLQLEGVETVNKIAFAVDSSFSTFEQAAQSGADMLIVHHGLFWGSPLPITGMHRKRVAYLLETGINLYAAHIPLDAHREVGNNWGLARLLAMTELEDFGSWKGKPIGVKGSFPNGMSLRELANTIETTLSQISGGKTTEPLMVHSGGDLEVHSLGIISGGASWDVVTAANEGLDAFLTGEPKHETFYEAFERGINALYAGHYMTETVGVNLLAEKIGAEFGLATEFIHLPTGL
ncbi:MAG: Nif3-like dinuclear metal center hexameric protein [Trueperaceae bacterium]|nr:Nif3-like dinuclear metal center hexameric protein [Trueperaceae bacterium]